MTKINNWFKGLLALGVFALTATASHAEMTLPTSVTGAFTDAGTVVGTIVGAGLVVCVAWLIGRIAKKGLGKFGAGLITWGLIMATQVHSQAAMAVPEEVTDAFTDAGTVVGTIIGAGLVVCVAWLIGRIAKKGLGKFGAG